MSEQLYPAGTLKHEIEKVAFLGFGNKKQPDEFDEMINKRNEAVGKLKANGQVLDSQIAANDSRIKDAVANGKDEVAKAAPKAQDAKPAAATPKVEAPAAPKTPKMRNLKEHMETPKMKDFGEHFQDTKVAPALGAVKSPKPVGSRMANKPKGLSPKGKLGLLGGAAVAGGSLIGLNAASNKKEQEKVAGTMTNRFLKVANDEEQEGYFEGVVRDNIAGGDITSANPAGAAIGGAALASLPAHMVYSGLRDSNAMDPKERTRSRLNMADPKDGQVIGRIKDYNRHLPTEELRVKRMRGGLMGAAGAGIVGAGAGMHHLSGLYNAELEKQLEEEEQVAFHDNQFLSKQANEEVYQALQLAEERRKAAELRNIMLQREQTMDESRDDTIGSLAALGLFGGGVLGAGLGQTITARKPFQAAGTIGGGLVGGIAGMMGGATLGEKIEGDELEEFRKKKLAPAVANHERIEDQFQARMIDKRAFSEVRDNMNKIASYYQ